MSKLTQAVALSRDTSDAHVVRPCQKTAAQQFSEKLFVEHFDEVCRIMKSQFHRLAKRYSLSGIEALEALPFVFERFTKHCNPFVTADNGIKYLRSAARVRTLEYFKQILNKRIGFVTEEMLAELTDGHTVELDDDLTATMAAMLAAEAGPPMGSTCVPTKLVRQIALLANNVGEVRQYVCSMQKAVAQLIARLVRKAKYAKDVASLKPSAKDSIAQTGHWSRHNLAQRMEAIEECCANAALDHDSEFWAKFKPLAEASRALHGLLLHIEQEHPSAFAAKPKAGKKAHMNDAPADSSGAQRVSDISDTSLRRIRAEFDDRRYKQRYWEDAPDLDRVAPFEEYFRLLLEAIQPLTQAGYSLILKASSAKARTQTTIPCDTTLN
jgi:hypothetical protein